MRAIYQPVDSSRRQRGIAIVIALHVLMAWLLISGTARKGLELLNKPMQAVVIQDVVIPPPPAPPKVLVPPQAKTEKIQPPPFIPPPELPVQFVAAPIIEAAATPPPAPPPIAQPAAVAAPASPSVARVDMAIACPVQVPPDMPRRALLDGAQGVVRAQIRIQDGIVQDVSILSGPRVFYAAVRSAMLQYKCTRTSGEVLATQDFNFKIQ